MDDKPEAPTVQHPALLTDDLLLQRDTAAASILDASERAELDGNLETLRSNFLLREFFTGISLGNLDEFTGSLDDFDMN